MIFILITLIASLLCSFIFYFLGEKKGRSIEQLAQKKSQQTSEDLLNRTKLLIEKEKNIAILEKNEKINKLKIDAQLKLQNLINDLSREKEDFLKYINSNIKYIENKIYDISSLSKEKAREIVLNKAKKDIKSDIQRYTYNKLSESKDLIKQRSKDILINSMERYTADIICDRNSLTVELKDNDIKGRLIGREGRNIKIFEQVTGVELLIDDTPNVVFLSCFDPLRREIAKNLLNELIDTSKINPTSIEEQYNKKALEFEKHLKEIGTNFLLDLKIEILEDELLTLIGKMKYRTSYGQNLLQHSKEVAIISGILASEIGEDVSLARKCGLFHDIGKVVDSDNEGTHVELGSMIAHKYNMSPEIINSIESHHGDTEKKYIVCELVSIADKLSASRPGARKETYEDFIKRLKDLENIANEFKCVDRAYAFQSGRELRVIVNSKKINDEKLGYLAYSIRKRIEEQTIYCGYVNVTVIRETRVMEKAK